MQTDTSEKTRLDKLARKAGEQVALFGNCAQGTLSALQHHFSIGTPETLKAATAMPGVALRGETCGALIGAIMALGIVMGREKPEETQAAQVTTIASRRLCHAFEKEFGSCNCRDIQRSLFGRSFDLTDPDDLSLFAKAGLSEKNCGIPAGLAARIAGMTIAENIT